jgi:hypothetical protein
VRTELLVRVGRVGVVLGLLDGGFVALDGDLGLAGAAGVG